MSEDWRSILEDDSSAEIYFLSNGEASIQTPPGFGRSEYQVMIEELWGEGEKQCRTDLERGIELMEESAGVVAESLQDMYRNTVSRNFDSEQYGKDAMKGFFGTVFFNGAPGLAALDWAGESIIHQNERNGYTLANSIYDVSEGETRTARLFYDEQDGEITVATPLWRNTDLDREVVEETASYLQSFEA